MTILPQFRPAVKSKPRDLLRIGLVRLRGAERFIAEVFDEARVDRADEDAGSGEPGGHRLIVSAGSSMQTFVSPSSSLIAAMRSLMDDCV